VCRDGRLCEVVKGKAQAAAAEGVSGGWRDGGWRWKALDGYLKNRGRYRTRSRWLRLFFGGLERSRRLCGGAVLLGSWIQRSRSRTMAIAADDDGL
jgi:hypothetical protein